MNVSSLVCCEPATHAVLLRPSRLQQAYVRQPTVILERIVIASFDELVPGIRVMVMPIEPCS
jgi:hypothetical protein